LFGSLEAELLTHESVEAVPFKERVPALWAEVNKCSALTSNTSATRLDAGGMGVGAGLSSGRDRVDDCR